MTNISETYITFKNFTNNNTRKKIFVQLKSFKDVKRHIKEPVIHGIWNLDTDANVFWDAYEDILHFEMAELKKFKNWVRIIVKNNRVEMQIMSISKRNQAEFVSMMDTFFDHLVIDYISLPAITGK